MKTPKVPAEGLTPAIPPILVAQLLDAPDLNYPVGTRDRAILAMFAYMALRVEELHLTNVGDTFRNGEHTVVRINGKGNEERQGIMPPIAAAAVNNWIDLAGIRNRRSSPLFLPTASARGNGQDGFKSQRLSIRPIQRLVKRYCGEVGIDPLVSVHSLRVTGATEAHRVSNGFLDIQHWLGHKDPSTTLRYIRGSEQLDRSPAYTIRF